MLNPISFNSAYINDKSLPKQAKSDSVFDNLKKNIDKLDNKVLKTSFDILSPIPTARRLNSLPDELEKENYSRSAGLLGLAFVNLPGDTRELSLAVQEGKNFIKGNPFVYEGQHAARFFKAHS